jgi:hypothetical protein
MGRRVIKESHYCNLKFRTVIVSNAIRRLLRERATLYRVMADMSAPTTSYDVFLRRIEAMKQGERLVSRERGRAK